MINFKEIKNSISKFVIKKEPYNNSISNLKNNIGDNIKKHYEKMKVLDEKAYKLMEKRLKNIQYFNIYKNVEFGNNVPNLEPVLLFSNNVNKIMNSKFACYNHSFIRLKYKSLINELVYQFSEKIDELKL